MITVHFETPSGHEIDHEVLGEVETDAEAEALARKHAKENYDVTELFFTSDGLVDAEGSLYYSFV